MTDLARTIVVCGLVSGTQPFTILGLLLILGGGHGKRNARWYVFGAFTVQAVVVLLSGLLVAGTVDADSAPGRSLIGLRIATGVVLVGLGIWLRREPTSPAPDRPKIFERLTDLRPFGAFLAGVAIADYQGAVLAAAALATSDVQGSSRVGAWVLYCLFATGIPVVAMVAVTRSAKARTDLERAIAWVLAHRRMLASWFCLVGGAALVIDGATTLLLLD